MRLGILLTAISTLSAACQPDAAISSDDSPPSGWPLAIGEMVDGKTRESLEEEFSDSKYGTASYSYDLAYAKNVQPNGQVQYACLPDGDTAADDEDVARIINGRTYLVIHLPEGTPCDPDALYSTRWVYRGHR